MRLSLAGAVALGCALVHGVLVVLFIWFADAECGSDCVRIDSPGRTVAIFGPGVTAAVFIALALAAGILEREVWPWLWLGAVAVFVTGLLSAELLVPVLPH